jgi:NADPH-dependent curcumin reductase CurA
MNKLGRIALCGAMKTYSNFNNKSGISNYNLIITKQLYLKGVTFVDIGEKFSEAI